MSAPDPGGFGRKEVDSTDDTVFEGVVRPTQAPGDSEVEASIRPRSLAEFVGQVRVREQLELVLAGAGLCISLAALAGMYRKPLPARPAPAPSV